MPNQPVSGQDRGSIPQNQPGSKPNNIFGQTSGPTKSNPFEASTKDQLFGKANQQGGN